MRKEKGLIIFGAILIIVFIAAPAACLMTGRKGIEDWYATAAGLPQGEEDGEETFSGFSAVGDPMLSVIVPGILIVGWYVAYRHLRI